MKKFLDIMDAAIKRELEIAESKGFKDCQKYYDDKMNEVLLQIGGELLDIRDKEIELSKIQNRLDNLLNFINKYRMREELY